MATSFWFNGRKVTLPGVYSKIESGIKNPLRELDYGVALFIDTGIDNRVTQYYGSGPGINGTLTDGPSPIQEFDNMLSLRNAVGGGFVWAAAPFLFQPKGVGIPGISKLYYVRAATTVPATLTFSPTGGGSAGGTIALDVRNEGQVGNGVLESSELVLGYSFKMRAGRTSGKFVLDFYRGSYRGNEDNVTTTISWDGKTKSVSTPNLLITTPEFSALADIQDWMNTNSNFQSHFSVKTFTITGTGAVTSADAATYANHTLAAGGTESFASTDLADALTEITELDYTFILSDVFGTDAYQSTTISSIIYHLATEAKFEKYLIIGGGADADEFDQSTDSSIAIAEENDSSRVVVVHGDFLKSIRLINSEGSSIARKQYPSFFKAANALGRILGNEPQVPGTFKTIDIDAEVHQLTKQEKELALQKGVLATCYDIEFGDFTILQSINTLQDNSFLINEDGQSYEISIERIKAQLNKELVVLAKQTLLGQTNGVNRNTLSKQDVKNFTEGYLKMKIADKTNDNLILMYQNVTVDVIEDAYEVRFEFAPNTPINKLFFASTVVEF